MQIPAEFLAKLQDSNNKWFTMTQPENSKEPTVVSETKILQDEQDSNIFQVGIKQDKYTMVYKIITNMTYEPSAGGSVSDYFNIICSDTSKYKLFCANGVEHNLSNELVTNKTEKMVHLIKGIPGPKGDSGTNGMSSYELWSQKYPGISQDEFIKNLNNVYSYGAQANAVITKVKKLTGVVEELQEQLHAVKERLTFNGQIYKPDVLPISTIIYSHNNPDPSRWLPFGFSNRIYNNTDYPELSRIVRGWGAAFIVDAHRFKLGDASDVNRYIFCAGGSRPAGFIMSSQLPNITGRFTGGDNNNWANGVFRIVGWEHWTGDGRNAIPVIDFNASRSSTIYKDSVTQVFGDAISMNAYIKALM